jgi:urea transport system ATP-binding protein
VSGSDPAALLEVRSLAKAFGGVQALAGVDLELAAGELRCIIGPNGCGKTTLFNVITGAFAPSSGRVRFGGVDITGLRPHQIARRGIARKFQVPGIYPSLTVSENLEVPAAAAAARRGPLGLLRAPARAAARDELLDRLGLSGLMTRPAGTLAHGQKQWLEIAMLLAGEARLLLLDEPTAGMTMAETAASADLLREVRQQSDVAVLVIEHDMSFVERLECPVVVMMRGAVVRAGSYGEIRRDPAVREAYLGESASC